MGGVACLVFQMQGVRGAWLCCQGSAAVVQSPLKITPQQPAGGPLRVDERLQPAAAAVLQLLKHSAAPLLTALHVACAATHIVSQ